MAPKRKSAQQVIPLEFKGVRDNAESGGQSRSFLQDAINVYWPDAEGGSGAHARPGFNELTTDGLNSNGEVYALFSTSASIVFAVVAGKIYRYDGSWTDVTPGTVTIDDGGVRIHIVEYDGEIIVSDSVNRPWRGTSLTSTPIVGTEIQVNSSSQAWAARGQPTVYGGKLFFIAKTINSVSFANRIVWCEEGDAATGYLQSGFTNSWDIHQQGSDTIYDLVGTNVALYYFRFSSIGAITGAVSSAFATTSTHDAVSQEIGISAHSTGGNAILAKGFIWFIDNTGRPQRFRVGSSTLEPLYKQMQHRISKMRQTAENGDGNAEVRAFIAYSTDLDKVAMMFLRDSSASVIASRNLYIFDADTGNYEGRWLIELTSQPASETPTAVRVSCLAAIRGATGAGGGRITFAVGGTLPGTTTEGHVWQQHLDAVTTYGDDEAAMHMSITTMLTPDEQNVEVRVDEVAVDVVPDTTAVSLDYYTPYGSSTGLSATGKASSDSIQSSFDHGIARFALGASALGRWFRCVFHKNVAAGTTQHVFERASLKVRTLKARGTAP